MAERFAGGGEAACREVAEKRERDEYQGGESHQTSDDECHRSLALNVDHKRVYRVVLRSRRSKDRNRQGDHDQDPNRPADACENPEQLCKPNGLHALRIKHRLRSATAGKKGSKACGHKGQPFQSSVRSWRGWISGGRFRNKLGIFLGAVLARGCLQRIVATRRGVGGHEPAECAHISGELK